MKMNGPRVPGDKKDTVALMEKGLDASIGSQAFLVPVGDELGRVTDEKGNVWVRLYVPSSMGPTLSPLMRGLRGLPMHRAAAIMNDGEATENERAQQSFDSAQDDNNTGPTQPPPFNGHINNRLINEIWETMRTDEIRRWAL